jgi:hypothetical protein
MAKKTKTSTTTGRYSKRTNTQSLSDLHKKQMNIIHFIAGSNLGFGSVKTAGFTSKTGALIYAALAKREYSKLLARPGISSNDLKIVNGRTDLSRKLETDFNILRIFNANPIIARTAKAIDIGVRALTTPINIAKTNPSQQSLSRLQHRLTRIQNMLNSVTQSYHQIDASIGRTINNLSGNIIGHYHNDPSKMFSSYFGSMNNMFGLIGELKNVEETKGIVYLNGMFDKKYTESSMVPMVGNIKQLADVSMMINFSQFTNKGPTSKISVNFSVAPISIKTSKRDNTRQFSAYGGNPIPYMHPVVFSDFINVYLSSSRSIAAILAAIVADMALVSRTSATGEILFLIKQTPNFLDIYLMYEIFHWYSQQNLAKDLPSLTITDFNYDSESYSPFSELNNMLVAGASTDVEKGRKFYSSIAAENITRNYGIPAYVNVADAVKTQHTKYKGMKAGIKAIFPPRIDKLQILANANHIVNHYRNNPPQGALVSALKSVALKKTP